MNSSLPSLVGSTVNSIPVKWLFGDLGRETNRTCTQPAVQGDTNVPGDLEPQYSRHVFTDFEHSKKMLKANN